MNFDEYKIRQAFSDKDWQEIKTHDTWQIFKDWMSIVTTSFDIGTNERSGANAALNEGDLDLPDISSFNASFGWDLSQLSTNGTISIQLVPEPSRAILLMLGLLSLLLRRRRR